MPRSGPREGLHEVNSGRPDTSGKRLFSVHCWSHYLSLRSVRAAQRRSAAAVGTGLLSMLGPNSAEAATPDPNDARGRFISTIQ